MSLVQEDRRRQCSTVRRVLEHVFCARGVCCEKEGDVTAHQLVGLRELASMIAGDVRESHYVISVADGWRSPVDGGIAVEEVQNRKRRARR
eukprot:2692305-Pleurochrysis_carterae.AAC.2